MSNTNIVVLTGHLGAVPDYRVFPQSGNGVATLRMAVNKHRRNALTGEFDTVTTWVSIRLFGKLAERAREKLTKGDKVTITGELAEDTWVDRDSGQQRSWLYVVGTACELLSGKSHQGHQPTEQSPVVVSEPHPKDPPTAPATPASRRPAGY